MEEGEVEAIPLRRSQRPDAGLHTPLDKLALHSPPILVLQAGIFQGSFYHLFITITPTVPPSSFHTYKPDSSTFYIALFHTPSFSLT